MLHVRAGASIDFRISQAAGNATWPTCEHAANAIDGGKNNIQITSITSIQNLPQKSALGGPPTQDEAIARGKVQRGRRLCLRAPQWRITNSLPAAGHVEVYPSPLSTLQRLI